MRRRFRKLQFASNGAVDDDWAVFAASFVHFSPLKSSLSSPAKEAGGMGVKLVVAVTDGDWFDHLRALPHLAEVNFWSPSDRTFRALEPGELFLFKLHAPRNFIVGGGWFAHATILPCSLAWEAFGEENGAATLREMRARIVRYTKRSTEDREDFHIGCRILTQPFFLPEHAWIPVDDLWPRNIVSFKTFSTDEPDGMRLWDKVQEAVSAPASPGLPSLRRGMASRLWCARVSVRGRFAFLSPIITIAGAR